MIILITGNQNKLKEFEKILGEKILSEKIDLKEIQDLNSEKIILHKVRDAYKIVKKPVIVEDVSLELNEFKGLPGPFIKFFEKQFPQESMIKMLGNSKNRKAKIKAYIAYKDKKNEFVIHSEIEGKISWEKKGNEGFGFDYYFIPKGNKKTYAEMGIEEKNKISHRRKAIDLLKKELEKRKI